MCQNRMCMLYYNFPSVSVVYQNSKYAKYVSLTLSAKYESIFNVEVLELAQFLYYLSEETIFMISVFETVWELQFQYRLSNYFQQLQSYCVLKFLSIISQGWNTNIASHLFCNVILMFSCLKVNLSVQYVCRLIYLR